MAVLILAACLAVCALQGTSAQLARGTYVNVTGVELLNLTLSTTLGSAATSSQLLCTVGNLPTPYYSESGIPDVASGFDLSEPLALLYVNVSLGSVATVTFYGGEVESGSPYPTGYNPPYITTVEGSTDTGAATGPLYVTKTPVGTGLEQQQELDLAEFYPTAVGQTGYVYGGLTDVGVADACIYNITFTAVPASSGEAGK